MLRAITYWLLTFEHSTPNGWPYSLITWIEYVRERSGLSLVQTENRNSRIRFPSVDVFWFDGRYNFRKSSAVSHLYGDKNVIHTFCSNLCSYQLESRSSSEPSKVPIIIALNLILSLLCVAIWILKRQKAHPMMLGHAAKRCAWVSVTLLIRLKQCNFTFIGLKRGFALRTTIHKQIGFICRFSSDFVWLMLFNWFGHVLVRLQRTGNQQIINFQFQMLLQLLRRLHCLESERCYGIVDNMFPIE